MPQQRSVAPFSGQSQLVEVVSCGTHSSPTCLPFSFFLFFSFLFFMLPAVSAHTHPSCAAAAPSLPPSLPNPTNSHAPPSFRFLLSCSLPSFSSPPSLPPLISKGRELIRYFNSSYLTHHTNQPTCTPSRSRRAPKRSADLSQDRPPALPEPPRPRRLSSSSSASGLSDESDKAGAGG